MTIDPSNLAQFLRGNWHSRTGLWAALVSAIVAGSFILAQASASWPIAVIVLTVILIAVYSVWHNSQKVPKTKNGCVGFVISIGSDDDDESRRVRADFVIPLRQLLGSGGRSKDFHFIEFPQHLVERINDQADAEKLRAKARAHFMLYGRVRVRVLDGKEHHIIELDGIVSHKPIPEHTQKLVAAEFSELLPRRVTFSRENDLLSFQFTSEWAGVVAEYIIAIAMGISGDLNYAEELFSGCLNKLANLNHQFPIYATLVDRIPVRISQINEVRAVLAHEKWSSNKQDMDAIDELGKHLEKIVGQGVTEPSMLFLLAVYEFVKNRDTKAALDAVKKIKGAANGKASPNVVGTWNYNVGFLCAYDGKLSVATRHYQKAAMAVVQPEVISQVEDFLVWALEQEPEKYQLHYCLGYFNWKTKGDVAQAASDFGNFMAARRAGEFEKEATAAEGWVTEFGSKKEG